MSQYRIDERYEDTSGRGGWHAKVHVWRRVNNCMVPNSERVLLVGVYGGSHRVRIAFKPRGTYGRHWHAYVREPGGATIAEFRVPKSIGVHGILVDAGVIECEHKQRPPKYRGQSPSRVCRCGAERQPDGTWRRIP